MRLPVPAEQLVQLDRRKPAEPRLRGGVVLVHPAPEKGVRFVERWEAEAGQLGVDSLDVGREVGLHGVSAAPRVGARGTCGGSEGSRKGLRPAAARRKSLAQGWRPWGAAVKGSQSVARLARSGYVRRPAAGKQITRGRFTEAVRHTTSGPLASVEPSPLAFDDPTEPPHLVEPRARWSRAVLHGDTRPGAHTDRLHRGWAPTRRLPRRLSRRVAGARRGGAGAGTAGARWPS